MRSSGRVHAEDPIAIIEGLEAFKNRGAGTDAERRAAGWLAARLAGPGVDVRVETFWSRPNWALAHAWHAALAIGGSLISLASPVAGITLLAIALASVISDAFTGVSVGRRLTPERASQNVIAGPADSAAEIPRLVLTANYDSGRRGVAYRVKPMSARLVATLRGATAGWIAWLAVAMAWLLAIAVLRQTGHTSHTVRALQFPPTVGLLLGLALLIDLATGQWSPAASDNGSGVAAALELAEAMAAAPPHNLGVEVLLSGAGDGDALGLARYLRTRRTRRRLLRGRRRPQAPAQVIVLAIAACGSGTPRWWESDGALLPLRYSATLRRIADQVGRDEPHLRAHPHRGRSNSGGYAARAAGLPALTIGCLADPGIVPRSHQKTDTTDAVERQSLERIVQFALLLIDAVDAEVGKHQPRSAAATA